MIVCFVGQPLSGKDAAGDYLKRKGFSNISTGNIIREEMEKNNLPTEPRENIRSFVKERRWQYGNQYPAEIAIERISDVIDTVISGPRNMAEIDAFRKKFGNKFVLVAINASIEIRYKRTKNNSRERAGDNISSEQFKEEEDIERGGGSGSHELDKVMRDADYIVPNNTSKEEFFRSIDGLLLLLRSNGKVSPCH